MYNHTKAEQKWREQWEKSGIYKTPTDATHKNKYYILPQLPYPSGSNLHVGHAEGYTACDIFARFQRMQGKRVLQVIGWDAFGLPAENYAIKTNIHPRISTNKAIDNFRVQIKKLGMSVDWDHEVGSHNPDYYKWTQWFFLLMYKRGLAYRKNQQVNWCDSCKTVLANEQVIDGKCERCGTEVEQKMMEQWYLKITDYADRLYDDLDKVDWPEESVKRQRDWIGRSTGALIKFKIQSQKSKIENQKSLSQYLEVFTTRPDTIFGATFMVISPEHELINDLQSAISNYEEIAKYIEQAKQKTELERQQNKDKSGVELKGIQAVNPATGEEIPIFVAEYVLSGYGTGAIMAVPAHDERDMAFAQAHKLEIVDVIEKPADFTGEFFTGENITINSGEFTGLTSAEAKQKIVTWLQEKKLAQPQTTFKLRDWSVSRQRFWGAPIPMVYDPEGNLQPVDEKDLPVILPDDVDFKPTGQSPLTYSKEFQKGVEEKYGKGWRREVDTLDTFMCSSWYYYRYLDPHNDKEFASPELLKTWMPVDFYIGGPEHVTGHLLYSRFFTKVLYDAGYINFDEPFLFHRHQGLVLGEDGRKMSKRWGNVINPSEIADKYGADTLRMYEMFMGPLEQAKAWNDRAVQGVRRFITRVYEMNQTMKELGNPQQSNISPRTHKLIRKVTADTQNLRFNVAISEFMKYLNEFESEDCKLATEDWIVFLRLLAPYAPFVTEECWEQLGHKDSIHTENWPMWDEKLVADESVTIGVQVNGKTRSELEISPNASEAEAKKLATENEAVQKWMDGKEIRKFIYVPGKIINIVC